MGMPARDRVLLPGPEDGGCYPLPQNQKSSFVQLSHHPKLVCFPAIWVCLTVKATPSSTSADSSALRLAPGEGRHLPCPEVLPARTAHDLEVQKDFRTKQHSRVSGVWLARAPSSGPRQSKLTGKLPLLPRCLPWTWGRASCLPAPSCALNKPTTHVGGASHEFSPIRLWLWNKNLLGSGLRGPPVRNSHSNGRRGSGARWDFAVEFVCSICWRPEGCT